MQAIHDLDAIAVLNFQHALLFEALRGFAHDAATDAKRFSKGALTGQPTVIFIRSRTTDEFSELLADGIDK
jgi:hypothetical protein